MTDKPSVQSQQMIEYIGQVTVSWNTAQYMIFLLFKTLARLGHYEAEAIYYTLRSDASQRDITLAVAEVVLAGNEPLLTKMREVFADVGKHAGERNAFSHTTWVRAPENTLQPMPLLKPHGKLDQANPAQQCAELSGKIWDTSIQIVRLITPINAHLEARQKAREQLVQPSRAAKAGDPP